MLESLPAFINTLLLAWVLRTSIILWLAHQHKASNINLPDHGKSTAEPSHDAPVASIVIPAFNEEPALHKAMLSCIAASYANKEIIVVDDGSTDGTSNVAKRIQAEHPTQRIKVLNSHHNQGKAEALNLGLSQATGEIIVTLDADTQFETSHTLTALLQPLIKRPEISAITANLKIANSTTTLGKFQAIEYAKIIQTIKRAQSQTNTILILPGALSAFRRGPLQTIGGFSKATLAEDADATMTLLRRSHHLVLNTNASGCTEAPTSISAFIKQRIRWRIGQWQCLWKHRALNRQSLATCFFYLDVVATNCITAATPAIIALSLWRILHEGDWQSSAWATSGFIATDILVTATTAQLDQTFRPTPRSYISSLFFFLAISPWITWLSLIKLSRKKRIHW